MKQIINIFVNMPILHHKMNQRFIRLIDLNKSFKNNKISTQINYVLLYIEVNMRWIPIWELPTLNIEF